MAIKLKNNSFISIENVENIKKIKYNTFNRKADSIELQKELGYSFFFLMKNDWRTTYYVGKHKDVAVYILKHLKDYYIFAN